MRELTLNLAVVQYEVLLDGGAPRRLMLWPSTSFLAPALRVDRPGGGADAEAARPRPRRSPRRRRSVTTCHYRGVVQGDPRSSVAVSACGQGLVSAGGGCCSVHRLKLSVRFAALLR